MGATSITTLVFVVLILFIVVAILAIQTDALKRILKVEKEIRDKSQSLTQSASQAFQRFGIRK